MSFIIITLFAFNPFYFIHYSDPQIGRNAQTVPYCSLAVNQIGQMSPAPNFVLVCGDMADDPTNQSIVQSQWRICDSLFDLLPMPKYYAPGNNDLGYANEGCWTPSQLALYRGFWGPDYYAFSRDSCYFICLNSTLLDTYSGHACYSYSLEQDSFMRATFASIQPHEYKNLFLFFHFPLFIAYPTEDNSGSNVDRPRRDTILADLDEYRVTSVLTGHLHTDLMNFYRPSLLMSGLATCETSIGSCGYRAVKVFENGLETFVIWLQSPIDTLPMVNIVTPGVNLDTVHVGDTVSFSCVVDSNQFPDWRGLTYSWQFGDGQTSSSPETSYAYTDTGHYNVVFNAYKTPHLAALYHFKVVVEPDQSIVENINDHYKSPNFHVITSVVKDKFIYEITRKGSVSIDLYQANGRLILSQKLGILSPGRHHVNFGSPLSTGIYFVRLESNGYSITQKIIQIK